MHETLIKVALAADEGLQKVRPVSTYDEPTPEKRAFGERMRKARDMAGISLTDAATVMGYSQPVQLSNMENGNRMPTLRVLMGLAEMYGTTLDYLAGHSGDPARDPAAGAHALVAARVTSEMRSLISAMIASSVEAVRRLRPEEAQSVRLAAVVIEAAAALARLRQRVPEFDDLPSTNTLVVKVELAALLAGEHLSASARAHPGTGTWASSAKPSPGHPPDDEVPTGHSLLALQPLTELELSHDEE